MGTLISHGQAQDTLVHPGPVSCRVTRRDVQWSRAEVCAHCPGPGPSCRPREGPPVGLVASDLGTGSPELFLWP